MNDLLTECPAQGLLPRGGRYYFPPGVVAGSFSKFGRVPLESSPPKLFREAGLFVLSGEKFTLVSSSNGMVEESKYLNKDAWWLEDFLKHDKAHRLKDKVVVIGNPGYKNYYHWVYQIWISLVFIKNSLGDLSGWRILGPSLNSWRRQFIDWLGVGDIYIEADPRAMYFIDDAVYTDACWGRFSFSPSRDLLDLLNPFFDDTGFSFGERIFVSRKDTTKRGVENEDELAEALSSLGFKSVLMSDFSVKEQAKIFRNAECIVAPHGAGLTNLVFSTSRTKLVELLPDDYLNPCFYSIAAEKDMDYAAVVCRSNASTLGYHHSMMSVDVDFVVNVVEKGFADE